MSERCDRFEREGFIEELSAEDQAHLDTCPDCQASRDAARRIVGELGSLGRSNTLRADARSRLWEAVDREVPPRRRLVFPVVGAVIAAAAAVFAFLVFVPPRAGPELRYEVLRGDQVMRAAGEVIVPGDRLRVFADAAPHAELRVYRNRTELVARGTDRVELRLDAPGSYELLLVYGEAPIPVPIPPSTGSIDGDIAKAVEQQMKYQLRELEVR
jgi:hypothetical protein